VIYRHYKGGLYRVLFNGTDSTNERSGTPVVVYVSLTNGRVFVRDAREFHGVTEDGQRRFEPTE